MTSAVLVTSMRPADTRFVQVAFSALGVSKNPGCVLALLFCVRGAGRALVPGMSSSYTFIQGERTGSS